MENGASPNANDEALEAFLEATEAPNEHGVDESAYQRFLAQVTFWEPAWFVDGAWASVIFGYCTGWTWPFYLASFLLIIGIITVVFQLLERKEKRRKRAEELRKREEELEKREEELEKREEELEKREEELEKREEELEKREEDLDKWED